MNAQVRRQNSRLGVMNEALEESEARTARVNARAHNVGYYGRPDLPTCCVVLDPVSTPIRITRYAYVARLYYEPEEHITPQGAARALPFPSDARRRASSSSCRSKRRALPVIYCSTSVTSRVTCLTEAPRRLSLTRA